MSTLKASKKAQAPLPPSQKRLQRPKITLQMPDPNTPMPQRIPQTAQTIYWVPPKYPGHPPGTPGPNVADPNVNPYFNPFMHMYQNKASDFMFKQFAGFKDFTMNTAKSGLSAGEKSAFWFINKLRLLSKKWFTHLFLSLCLVLYSVMGAAMFVALEGPNEDKFDGNLTQARAEVANTIQDLVLRYDLHLQSKSQFLEMIDDHLIEYENKYTECMKHINNNNTTKKTWTFWNSMFYAGTIYTTIAMASSVAYQTTPELSHAVARFQGHALITFMFVLRVKLTRLSSVPFWLITAQFVWQLKIKTVMNKEGKDSDNPLTLRIPIIKADSETQTTSLLFPSSPRRESLRDNMEQGQNLRKRRNLSKNRGQARQREKTPDPGRVVPHEDTTTSDDEDVIPNRSSREVEADNTYEEMKRLVLEKSNNKDPVYDLDTEEVLEARAIAATERRRRSISPFAVPDADKESSLEHKGSFTDPTNKLLSTTYSLTPKDEGTGRRSSLVIETIKERRNSLTILTPPPNSSPKEKGDFQYPISIPTTPKKLEEMVYPDEVKNVETDQLKKSASPKKKDNVFNFETEEDKPKIAKTPITTDIPIPVSGEIVTKVIQVERTPSKKLSDENKPKVEIRQRVVRTPSRKSEIKPVISKQIIKEPKEEAPPVRPPRSRSASRLGGKTSESEMSEDQGRYKLDTNLAGASRRKVTPTPRRFLRNKSPRANRSQSVSRAEESQVTLSGTGISQTSKEIIALMQQARARSLSIPKDDPKLAPEYKKYSKKLATPNKTPTNLRQSRGISCPKTIQIISNKEILQGIPASTKKKVLEKNSRQSSGYVEASHSEYTSSCYSTSPSDNEHNFNLSERTAELTRKLNILSQEVETLEDHNSIILSSDPNKDKIETKNVLRRRKPCDSKVTNENISEKIEQRQNYKDKKPIKVKSKWKFLANWQQFKEEHDREVKALILLRNKCICDFLLIIITCGLGGMMFKTLEGSFENAFKCSTRNVKRDFIESLWRGSQHMREEEWKSMARRKLYEFEDQLHTAHEAGVTSYSGQRSWNFMNSFVYCLTLISTIGYGHIAPKTTYGRVATIIYAIIGIPLFLIVLADFGKLFTRIIKFFWAFIRRFYYTRSCKKVRRTVPVQEVMKGLNIVYDVVRRPSQMFNEEDMKAAAAARTDSLDEPPTLPRKPSEVPPPLPPKPGFVVNDDETEPGTPPSVYEIDDEFNLPISVAIVILIIYMIIGAVGYNIWENWSFLESFYFVFISMSTIGLGDLVPDHPMFMMASILYLVFGLALTSMCINVVQVKLSDTFKQASAKIGATIGLKVAEEDGSLVPITPPPLEIVPVHKPRKVENDKDDLNNSTEIDLSNR